jgi:hypothetical protein
MIIRDPEKLSPQTNILWTKQEGLIKIYNLPFRLFETLRDAERQATLFKNGASQKEHSNHQDGEAWDVAEWKNNDWTWEDLFFFQVLGILTVSLIEGIRWGADWNGKNFWFDEKFKDFCHYEIKK